MDTNSKIIAESKTREERNLNKFLNTLEKLKKLKKVFYIAVGVIMVVMILTNPIKKLAIAISLFIIMMILYVKRMMQDFRDIGIFQEIYQITNTTEDVAGILEKTNEDYVEQILGKSHKNIKENLYKVEKLMYSSIIKGKQSENLANELVVDVSQNLKKPVQNIRLHVEELEGCNKENYKLCLDKLEEESNILKYNIEELFELAKVMTGSIDLDIRDVDIKNLTKQALAEYEEKLENNNLKLVTNIQSDRMMISADGIKMWRVFEIFLDNVVSYSKENSRVYVNLYKEDDKVVVSLMNISKDELNIDLKTFYENIRDNTKKNKMGLAIAKNLISVQGGDIDIVIDGDMFKVEMKFSEMKEAAE